MKEPEKNLVDVIFAMQEIIKTQDHTLLVCESFYAKLELLKEGMIIACNSIIRLEERIKTLESLKIDRKYDHLN